MTKYPNLGFTRTCPAAGCRRSIPSGKFVCPTHWRLLTPVQQRAINEAWAAYNAAKDVSAVGIALNNLRAVQEQTLIDAGLIGEGD